MNRFYSKCNRDVWLAAGTVTWQRLPLIMKRRLLNGLERIANLRNRIGAETAVSSMPPVQVVPELWYGDGVSYDGCASALIVKGKSVFGCILPAQTATLEDEGILRRVMVHEFSHCFWFIVEAVRRFDAGTTTMIDVAGDIKSDSYDRSVMVPPEAWFGQADAEGMIYHDTADKGEIHRNLVELNTFFPSRRNPPGEFSVTSIAVQDDVIAHARKLSKHLKR